jgi:condensin complex subunit 2
LLALGAAAAEADGAPKADVKGKGRKNEPQKIDFLTPPTKSLKEMAEELFAPPGKGQSINLPGTAGNKRGAKRKKGASAVKKDEHLLPDDMHFSSKQLVTLFLKPKFVVRPIVIATLSYAYCSSPYSSRCVASAPA